MRFLVLVAAASVGSAVTVASLKTVFPQQDASMRATLAAAASAMAQFRLSDLNPVRWAYDQVISEIASPRPNAALDFKSAPVVVGEFKMPPIGISQPRPGGAYVAPMTQLHGTTVRCGRYGVTIPCN
jgi:hypothetical protein